MYFINIIVEEFGDGEGNIPRAADNRFRQFAADMWEAEVQLCAYDRIPGGIVSRRLMEQTWLETPGGRRDPPKGSGRGNWRVEYGSCYVRLSPEDTYVVLRFEAFDEQIRLELPLPEQEGL